jgi:RimJ/RimL family protein N-acetyltransferase
LATESALAIRDWFFASTGQALLASFVRPANAGSIGVLRKLGATRTGTLTLLGGDAERWEHRPA